MIQLVWIAVKMKATKAGFDAVRAVRPTTAEALVTVRVACVPPLVFAGDARNLKKALSRVAMGEGFLMQGGDCAESFSEASANNVSANNIRDFLRVFLLFFFMLPAPAEFSLFPLRRLFRH